MANSATKLCLGIGTGPDRIEVCLPVQTLNESQQQAALTAAQGLVAITGGTACLTTASCC